MRKTAGGNRQPINIVGGSTFGRYEKISPSRTYNMFMSKGGKNDDQFWLVNTPGYKRVYDLLPTGSGRGLFTSTRGNIIIAVVNSFVYALDTNLAPTLIGTLATESGEVFIDENLSSQICIVDGINAYIYNYTLPPNLTIQTLAADLIPNYVEYHNSYFLFGNSSPINGSLWYIYQFSTATTITLVTQRALQTKPDNALAIVRLPSQASNVLVLGATVGEIWTQVAGQEVYRRNSTIGVDYGVISVSTIARSDTFVAWIGINESNSPVLMVYSGQGAQTISTMGIDYVLDNIQFPKESTAMFVRQDGHLLYQFTFYNPADNITLLYDFSTGNFFDFTDHQLNYHPARNYVYFNGQTYFISLKNASLYNTSTNYTTYDENLAPLSPDRTLIHEIPRVRICDTIQADDSAQFRANTFVFTIEQGQDPLVTGTSLLNNNIYMITEPSVSPYNIIMVTEWGVAIITENSGSGVGAPPNPPPYRPRVDMSISRDSGITWSNTVSRGLNPVGLRENILNWENIGACNSLTIKLRFWGLSMFVVYNGVVEIY